MIQDLPYGGFKFLTDKEIYFKKYILKIYFRG